MTTPEAEPRRIKNLRLAIIKHIPKFPNDRATKEALEKKSLGTLFIHYINWASRSIPPRPRIIQIEPTATNDPRWRKQREEINALLEKVRAGDDLTPHLSLQAHTQGFTPAAAAKSPEVDKWADKDFVLIVMGLHHFHLGTIAERAGHVTRTDNILFADVTRDKFTVVAIADHSVFKKTNQDTKTMTVERDRLWGIFTKRSSRGFPPGAVYVPAPIMTSGHSEHHVRLANYYARIVWEMDPKIDDESFVNSLYENAGVPTPSRPKLKWNLEYLDLGLLDEAQRMFFILQKGLR